jgi:transcriptional regulator with XRE-family HTH domain
VPEAATDPEARATLARELGLRLQRLRLAKGLSQEKVAHLAGISSYTYQKFEKGQSKPGTPMNPRLFTLLALADVLGVDAGDLISPWQ